MCYPIVTDTACKNWYRNWQAACEAAGTRVPAPCIPPVEFRSGGVDCDWDSLAESIVADLTEIFEEEDDKALEGKGAEALHSYLHDTLPDHEALRDPEFWYWFATVPGRELIEARYPFKPKESQDDEKKKVAYLPGRGNFAGQQAKEVLFFRLWIRAEMARQLDGDPEKKYEYVTPGAIDFWRSHVFRQLYAHHRPFLHAWVDFQFPDHDLEARLKTDAIRQLAKDLLKACANIQVELLDMDQCRALIERVWAKTEATAAWLKK